jgi:hypothetical protein
MVATKPRKVSGDPVEPCYRATPHRVRRNPRDDKGFQVRSERRAWATRRPGADPPRRKLHSPHGMASGSSGATGETEIFSIRAPTDRPGVSWRHQNLKRPDAPDTRRRAIRFICLRTTSRHRLRRVVSASMGIQAGRYGTCPRGYRANLQRGCAPRAAGWGGVSRCAS